MAFKSILSPFRGDLTSNPIKLSCLMLKRIEGALKCLFESLKVNIVFIALAQLFGFVLISGTFEIKMKFFAPIKNVLSITSDTLHSDFTRGEVFGLSFTV